MMPDDTANSPWIDPWQDAARLAARLQHAGSVCRIVLGALQWCETCRRLYPQLRTLAQQQTDACWLWLDLEDHQEFVGDYLPPDLPWLLQYVDCQLQYSGPLQHRLQAADWSGEIRTASQDPGILARLLQQDWASSDATSHPARPW